VLSLSVAALGPLLHGAHEDLCDPSVVLHDETQHRIQSPRGSDDGAADDHCVACHFARASRGAAAWEASGLVALADGGVLCPADRSIVAAPSATRLPARAPPR
jgi:hypothetical protein